eukprot:SAG25_NODE_375_length_8919_cov_7.676644_6_plen_55_part_00
MSREKQEAIRRQYLRNPAGFIANHPVLYEVLVQIGVPKHAHLEPGPYKVTNWFR